MSLEAVLARIDETLPEATDRLFELLRIPSISTDPVYRGHCARAAEWLADELRGLGFDAATRPTPGHPMVVGQSGGQGRHLLSPNGRRLVWLSRRNEGDAGELCIWDLETRKQLLRRNISHTLVDAALLPE